MNRDRRSSSQDPTAERTAAQSTQSSGLNTSTPGPNVDEQGAREEVVDRSTSDTTPRRYEQPVEEDPDPVMPADDSTLNTKI